MRWLGILLIEQCRVFALHCHSFSLRIPNGPGTEFEGVYSFDHQTFDAHPVYKMTNANGRTAFLHYVLGSTKTAGGVADMGFKPSWVVQTTLSNNEKEWANQLQAVSSAKFADGISKEIGNSGDWKMNTWESGVKKSAIMLSGLELSCSDGGAVKKVAQKKLPARFSNLNGKVSFKSKHNTNNVFRHPAHCSDGTMSGDETDVDCGGRCVGCAHKQGCLFGRDCLSKACNQQTKKCEGRMDPSLPMITLLGKNPDRITLDPKQEVEYLDPGANCLDPKEGDLSSQIDANLFSDIAKPGTHVMTYTCVDAAGLEAVPTTRTIVTTLDHSGVDKGDVEVAPKVGLQPVIDILGPNPDTVYLDHPDQNGLIHDKAADGDADANSDFHYIDPGAICSTAGQPKSGTGDLDNYVEVDMPSIAGVGKYIITYSCNPPARVSALRALPVTRTLVVLPPKSHLGDHSTVVDCSVTPFGSWSQCSQPCGGGIATRTRRATLRPMMGVVAGATGKKCPVLTQHKDCNFHACPSECAKHTWDEWTPCSRSCGGGMQMRPLQRLSQTQLRDKGNCPFLQQRICNTHMCRKPKQSGSKSGHPPFKGPAEVVVSAILPDDTLASLSEVKQQSILDALAATLQAASEDAAHYSPGARHVDGTTGARYTKEQSKAAATQAEIAIAKILEGRGAMAKKVPCTDKPKTYRLGKKGENAFHTQYKSFAYPCQLDTSTSGSGELSLEVHISAAKYSDALTLADLVAASNFGSDVRLVVNEAQQRAKKKGSGGKIATLGLLQMEHPRIVELSVGAAAAMSASNLLGLEGGQEEESFEDGFEENPGESAIIHHLRKHVARMRKIVKHLKPHHWVMVLGIVFGVSSVFTIYKAVAMKRQHELSSRRAWRRRNFQDGKELNRLEKERYMNSMRTASRLHGGHGGRKAKDSPRTYRDRERERRESERRISDMEGGGLSRRRSSGTDYQ